MIFLFVYLFVPFGHGAVRAQQADRMVSEIVKAFEEGSAKSIARHFGTNVELSMPRAEGTFSKSQSEVILRDFFSREAPSSFTIIYHGYSQDGSAFVIGRLFTKEGKYYRTYFLIKNVSHSFFLHYMQLELQ